jgi:hypothetical protein
LLAEDVILDRPRRWLVRLDREWEEGLALPENYRSGLAEFITCAWCLGFWVSVGVWLAWIIEPHGTLVVAVPFAISAAVGLIRTRLDEV